MQRKLCEHQGSCFRNAALGSAKAFLGAAAIRSAITLLSELVLKRGYKTPSAFVKVLFSGDSLRFCAFATLLNGLFKAALCTLRWLRQQEDGLNHLAAGAISGLSILVESKSRASTWCLYLGARVLDVLIRRVCSRYGGDANKIEVGLFIAMVNFMMYCYGVEKDNMPRSYFKFLDMVYHPSQNERLIMTEWCRLTKERLPLKQ